VTIANIASLAVRSIVTTLVVVAAAVSDDESDVRHGAGVFPPADRLPEAGGLQHAASQVQGKFARRSRGRAATSQRQLGVRCRLATFTSGSASFSLTRVRLNFLEMSILIFA